MYNSAVTQFRVTVAKNCQDVTRCTDMRYVAGLERARSFLDSNGF